MSIDLKKVPNTPGVYKFFNNHEIIYIGKAKDLKKRVSSYFGKSFKDRKTNQIRFLTNKVETFTTKNEVEALLLEQMLIKENKPKFNILLRDDKTYPYIYFSLDHDFPGIYLKRTKKGVDRKYFGPFVSSEAVKKSIKEIQKVFKIRNCSDNTFTNRTRPCIEFQMKRCSAPCVQNIKKIDYFEDITNAQSFLSSSDTKTVHKLNKDIEKAVKKLDFEKAAEIRDKLNRLNFLKEEQSVVTLAKDIDIFAVSSEMTYIGISIIVVRNGKIRGTKTHLIKQAHFESFDNIYQSAIFNFYENQSDIPRKILCAYSLENKQILEEMFKKQHKKKATIIHSPSKSIRPIFNLCKLNAKQVIKNHLSKKDKYSFALNELSGYFVDKNITKIEAFDISHISGENAVASCVTFSETGPVKNGYRLFNIPDELSGNDVGSMKHVIERRLKYYDEIDKKPDLILIDGGKTQLKFVQSVIKETCHNDIKVISIVKGINRLRATETILSDDGILELLLQEIRDESHRFAIKSQRNKKRSKIRKSELDKISGVGEVLKNRLLRKFRSLKNIRSATLSELMTVEGINEKIAINIKNNFK
jgi:excinuclease ABC subunit C